MRIDIIFKDRNGLNLEAGDYVKFHTTSTKLYYVNGNELAEYGGGDNTWHNGKIGVDRYGISIGGFYMSDIHYDSIVLSRRVERRDIPEKE